MRIQLCKEKYMAVEEFKDDIDKAKKSIDPYWDKAYIRPSFYIDSEKCVAEAYICTSCGTEFFRHYCCYGKLVIKDDNLKRYTANGQNIIKELRERIKNRKQQIMADFEKSKLPKTCPVCGMPLHAELCGKKSDKWGYNLVQVIGGSDDSRIENWDEKYFNSLIDAAFSELQYKIDERHDRQLEKDFQDLEIRIRPVGISERIANPQEILSNREKLIQYFKSLIQSERNINSLKIRIKALYKARIKNDAEVVLVNARPLIDMMKKIDADKIRFDQAEEAYRRCMDNVEACKSNSPTPVELPMPDRPTEPNYRKPGLFNKKKVLAENEAMELQYRADLLAFESECEKIQTEIERQNNQKQKEHLEKIKKAEKAVQDAKHKMEMLRVVPEKYKPDAPVEICPEKVKQKMIADEIEQAETMLKTFCQLRKDLFNAGIIHGNYYQYADWLSLCEYLETGRCTTLEGANGAYNLYEQEKRSNIAINKLSGIERSLHRIERGQAVISGQLMSMNATLNELNSTMNTACDAIMDIRTNTGNMSKYMNQISNSTQMIAYNTAATAYYSKMNAELTNALGFMVALK